MKLHKAKFPPILMFLLLFLFSCEDDEPFCWTETIYLDYAVKYKVTGSATSVSLTIENKDGGTSQFSHKSLPWTYTFTSNYDTWVYCSAQNNDQSGTVTVTIYVNDNVFKQSTSEGAYVIASASGTIDGDLYTEEIEHCD